MHDFTRTTLVSPPEIEPIDLYDVRAHLRVTHNEEDELLNALITAARVTVETITRRSLITQQWRLSLDAFPAGRVIKLPHTPVREVTAVEYYDQEGNLQALDPDKYWLDDLSAPARLMLKEGETFPDVEQGRPNAVEITYFAGYGDDPADVPAPVRHAIKLVVAHLYENPDIVSAGQLFTIPMSCDYLLSPYRVITFF
jgi:uncharacterized phiE125 gp8 family phage protein